MIYLLFDLRNKIPSFLSKIIPKFIRRKINKFFFNFTFEPTNYSNLPSCNYQSSNNYNYQNNLIKSFKLNSKQNSFMTCPYLLELLLMRYDCEKEFFFLDIGADNIDFF